MFMIKKVNKMTMTKIIQLYCIVLLIITPLSSFSTEEPTFIAKEVPYVIALKGEWVVIKSPLRLYKALQYRYIDGLLLF